MEAQQTYAEQDWDGNGVMEYAKKIVSSEGKKDGLYWPGDESPVAAVSPKRPRRDIRRRRPGYHGYFYKVLLAQGPDARAALRIT